MQGSLVQFIFLFTGPIKAKKRRIFWFFSGVSFGGIITKLCSGKRTNVIGFDRGKDREVW